MRTLLSLTVLLAGALGAPFAGAAPAASWTSSGNAVLLSDYVFRGVSQTQGKPAVQATLDLVHASGAYLGLFGSSVSNAAYNNSSGVEIDLYAGYRFPLSEGGNIDAGLVTYWYPGAYYRAGGEKIDYHTQDVKLGWNSGSFNLYGWVTVGQRWFGFAVDPYSGALVDSRRSTYLEANWNPELAPGLNLNLHAGTQRIRHLGVYNFHDAKIGITKTWGSWALSGAAIYNNGQVRDGELPLWVFFNADGSAKKVVGRRAQVALMRTF